MSGRAHARGGVNGDADVSRIGQARPPVVEPDPQSDVDCIRPGSCLDAALDGSCGGDGVGWLREDGEVLVGTRVDLPAAAWRTAVRWIPRTSANSRA